MERRGPVLHRVPAVGRQRGRARVPAKARGPAGERGRLRIGTSGWQYDHWRGVFYPEDLPKKRWFEFYAARFDTVEVNNTFYHLPGPNVFDAWQEAAPDGFCYVLKFSRYGSHLKRLLAPEETISRFVEVASRLNDHLGPILVQLPPRFQADPQRLDRFLAVAPDALRWAVEFRDPSWLCDEVYAVLERRRAALCIHDQIPDHPRILTAGWTYLRYHGVPKVVGYSPQQLSADARRIDRLLDRGRDVYVYFNNDAGGHAIQDAERLRRYLSGGD